ncbi:MAG TPA: serine/threonine-protein kinase [Kofleriaceae bacterium]|nr:serine/threonine-protein kinase [Kofleriaceae bacterium]
MTKDQSGKGSNGGGGGGTKLPSGSPTEPVAFGQYWLLGLIARGGMAEVYRARLRDVRGPQELMAIKVMRPELAREARFVDMFHREGQLAILLQNRSVVRTHEVGRIEGRHYIAMEYIGGRDLTQVLRRCQKSNLRIPVPHAVYIAMRIAEGLDFAHRLVGQDGRPLNIVNRDVSPSNVRLAYTGDVKLLDFGIAQALMKFTSEIGVLKGKFSYMSPEQIRGMPVDARTDVFSTGIILHEMLTTEKLFRGDTEFALMEKVRKADVDPPSKFNRRVTPELDAVVLRALARDVNDRYQSAAGLHRDLTQLLESYRFDPRELREFMRKEFRKEFLKEEEETQQALTASPDGPRLPEEPEPVTAVSRRRMVGPTADAPAPSAVGSLPSAPIGGHVSALPPRAMPHPTGAQGPGEPPGVTRRTLPGMGAQPGAGGGAQDDQGGFWSRLFKKKRPGE